MPFITAFFSLRLVHFAGRLLVMDLSALEEIDAGLGERYGSTTFENKMFQRCRGNGHTGGAPSPFSAKLEMVNAKAGAVRARRKPLRIQFLCKATHAHTTCRAYTLTFAEKKRVERASNSTTAGHKGLAEYPLLSDYGVGPSPATYHVYHPPLICPCSHPLWSRIYICFTCVGVQQPPSNPPQDKHQTAEERAQHFFTSSHGLETGDWRLETPPLLSSTPRKRDPFGMNRHTARPLCSCAANGTASCHMTEGN